MMSLSLLAGRTVQFTTLRTHGTLDTEIIIHCLVQKPATATKKWDMPRLNRRKINLNAPYGDENQNRAEHVMSLLLCFLVHYCRANQK